MEFLYTDAAGIIRVAVTAVLAYAALVILLRVSGKRTLADMNAFDFVVTVALGSTLASTILSPSVSLAQGLTALVVLVVLQAILAALGARFDWARRAMKAEPTLVVHRGELLRDAMLKTRLSEAAVLAAIRASGEADIADVHAVVLETNGEISVIPEPPGAKGAALEAARNPGV